jgi:hypothetical protein
MNPALTYLWLVLLKRRTLHFIRELRRPTTFIGFAALAVCFGYWLHYRHDEVFAYLVRPAVLVGGALLMIGGSVLMGFWHRGLVFDPPDVEFLFTSPFTQRQIVFYRLLPAYLFALVQGLVFLALFEPHLEHPLLTAFCLVLFQIACFHLATSAAIFAGTIPEQSHHRIRWMLLGVCFLITALYLRAAWGLKLIPAFVSAPFTQFLFYPALTLSDVATAPPANQWTLSLINNNSSRGWILWQGFVYLAFFAVVAAASLRLLLRLKADIFEPSLETTARAAEKRLRIRQGRRTVEVAERRTQSTSLPRNRCFRGVGAIIWKNLVVASRCKRELLFAAGFTLIYTGFLIALRWLLHQQMSQGGQLPAREVREFDKILVGLLCFLVFILQRAFPFDFRRDGHHLVGFRTLPVSPLALALAQLTVPTAFCLAFQGLGIVVLMILSGFDWLMVLLMLLAFPAVALALNGVWNLHYLLAATRRASGRSATTTPVAMVMVVALSFLIFYPAAWVAVLVGRHTFGPASEPLAFGAFLCVQYTLDFVLILILAKLFRGFEVSRDSP